MKIRDLLLVEYDQNKVNSLMAKYQARKPDPSAPKTANSIELANQIEKLGVTNGELVFWILNRYLTPTGEGYGINRWEDIASRLIPAIKKFEVLKRKPNLNPPLPTRDLNQIKSLSQLEDITEKYQEKELASKSEKASEEEQAFYDSKQATLVYNDDQIKVVVPHTMEASQYFGRNTRWCTAAKTNNRFNAYNKKGPLYIVLIKQENKRWQFHWPSKQFMNEADEEINPNELADQHPTLWKIFTPIAEKNKSLILNQNPSPKMQMAAVEKDGGLIRYIKNPSPKMQMAAVEKDGGSIQYIKNPSPEVQMAAVRQDGWSIKFITNPTPEMQMAAVKTAPALIGYIKNPTPEAQLAAVKRSGWMLRYIKNPTPEAQMAAVKNNSFAIEHIKDPTPEMQLAAVRKDGMALGYIKNPKPDVQLAALNQSAYAIQLIKNPTLEMQLIAIKKNPDLYWDYYKRRKPPPEVEAYMKSLK